MPSPDAGKHAAVGVKVPDNKNEHPQQGLNEADIVFVQLDGYPNRYGESGTRLLPVYHSQFPENVGPVRSVRPVDLPLCAPMNALIANTGSAPWVGQYFENHADVLDVSRTYISSKGTGRYSVNRDRIYTYKGKKEYDRAIVAHPGEHSQQAEKFTDGPPQDYFPFAKPGEAISTETGSTATQVVVPWHRGGKYAMTYDFDTTTGLYMRSMPWGEHVLADGARVTCDNILIILAEVTYEKLLPGGGGKEPIHQIEDASGKFFYAHGGKQVSGAWKKGKLNEPFEFTTDSGALKMAPGRTFVELPFAKSEVKFS